MQSDCYLSSAQPADMSGMLIRQSTDGKVEHTSQPPSVRAASRCLARNRREEQCMASPTTLRRKQNEPPTERSAERVTVALTSRVSHDLDQLRTMTGLSKTDLVNRALSLYLFVEQLRQQ